MPLENVVHATIVFRNIQERMCVLHLAILSITLYSVFKDNMSITSYLDENNVQY